MDSMNARQLQTEITLFEMLVDRNRAILDLHMQLTAAKEELIKVQAENTDSKERSDA